MLLKLYVPQAGLDKNTAQQILQVWEKSGAESPDQLRKLLIKRSVQSAGAVLVQTVLDAGKTSLDIFRTRLAIILGALLHETQHDVLTIISPALTLHSIVPGASWGGFSTASYLSAGGDFPGKIVVQYLAYFLGAEHALTFLHHLWACHARQQALTAYGHLLSDDA